MTDDNLVQATEQPDDEALLGALRRVAAEADPVPDDVLAAARAAILTRDLDSELARLVGDSGGIADPVGEGAVFEAVRTASAAGLAGTRLLSFSGGGVQIDLEVSREGDRVSLVGQLTGASAEGCALEHAGGAHPVDLDDLGRFLVSAEVRGPVRLRCRSLAGTAVKTAWVTI